MTNPWLKKNPYLSLWLSGANAVAARSRGPAIAAVRRQQTELVRQSMDFWLKAWTSPIKARPPKDRS